MAGCGLWVSIEETKPLGLYGVETHVGRRSP
jgi:hypothetical protein